MFSHSTQNDQHHFAGLRRLRTLGAMTVALAGSLCGISQPARAQFALPSPDLNVESVTITPVNSQGRWRVTATVRNGRSNDVLPRRTYPGGGEFKLIREGVGRIPVYYGNFGYPSMEVDDVTLASKTIPALAHKQTTTLSVELNGRGRFTGQVAPYPQQVDYPTPPPLDEINTANNTRTESNLVFKLLALDNAMLSTALGDSFGQMQIRLNRVDSYIRIPGILETFWDIPDITKEIAWATAHWTVNNINSNSVSMTLLGNELKFGVSFETAGHELLGWLDNGPDFLVPNINAQYLNINVTLPMSYSDAFQYFTYQNPRANVSAHWLVGDPWPDNYDSTINGAFSSRILQKLNQGSIKHTIEHNLNRLIRNRLLRDSFGNSGRIVGAAFGPSALILSVEVPWNNTPGGL